MKTGFGSALWGAPSEVAERQFRRFLEEEPTERYESDFDSLTHLCHRSLFDEGTMGGKLVAFIAAKQRKAEPFSIIRMNDGEGCLFFDSVFPGLDELNKYVVERISEIIFGSPKVIDQGVFHELLSAACVSADVIGMPTRGFPARRLDQEAEEKVDVRAVCGVKAQVRWLHENVRSGILSRDLILSSAWLSKQLLPHYATICSLYPNVVLVTGNPGLANVVMKKFKLPKVGEILIPTQRALKLGTNLEHIHYPLRYNQVLKELSQVEPRSLVLVAAGLLGKPYCAQVKKSGSSAIDIGHVADIWAGKISRPGVSDEFVQKWALTSD